MQQELQQESFARMNADFVLKIHRSMTQRGSGKDWRHFAISRLIRGLVCSPAAGIAACYYSLWQFGLHMDLFASSDTFQRLFLQWYQVTVQWLLHISNLDSETPCFTTFLNQLRRRKGHTHQDSCHSDFGSTDSTRSHQSMVPRSAWSWNSVSGEVASNVLSE